MASRLTPAILAAARQLRWVQSPTASLEHYLFPDLIEHPCTLTNMRGLFSDVIADQVMGYVIDAIKTHEMAIRSQVLMMLAQQPQEVLDTPKGKQMLQGKIRTIINDILKQKTGYGGVDNVYFTNFVIQ